MTQLVRSLLSGPTNWLGPVVRSSFPTGTALRNGTTGLTPDDQNRLTVPLNAKAARVGRAQCTEMAAQLLFTLQNLTPTVDEVELRGPGGTAAVRPDREPRGVGRRARVGPARRLPLLPRRQAPARTAGRRGRNDTTPTPVPGALGEGDKQLRSVAVSRDEDTAAGVGADGKSLYVAPLAADGPLGDPC